MAAMADKLNITANWRAAASPRIAAIHDDEGRVALLVGSGLGTTAVLANPEHYVGNREGTHLRKAEPQGLIRLHFTNSPRKSILLTLSIA
jgi:hypothetical protein